MKIIKTFPKFPLSMSQVLHLKNLKSHFWNLKYTFWRIWYLKIDSVKYKYYSFKKKYLKLKLKFYANFLTISNQNLKLGFHIQWPNASAEHSGLLLFYISISNLICAHNDAGYQTLRESIWCKELSVYSWESRFHHHRCANLRW